MGGETCELCGGMTQLEATVTHYIVPREVTKQAGLSDSATVILCPNCQKELDTWYAKRVFGMAYNSETKQFRPRSPAEMVKEYEAAYRAFANYKKGLRKIP